MFQRWKYSTNQDPFIHVFQLNSQRSFSTPFLAAVTWACWEGMQCWSFSILSISSARKEKSVWGWTVSMAPSFLSSVSFSSATFAQNHTSAQLRQTSNYLKIKQNRCKRSEAKSFFCIHDFSLFRIYIVNRFSSNFLVIYAVRAVQEGLTVLFYQWWTPKRGRIFGYFKDPL